MRDLLHEESNAIMRILEDTLLSDTDRISTYRAHAISHAIKAGAPPQLAEAHISEGHAMMNVMGMCIFRDS